MADATTATFVTSVLSCIASVLIITLYLRFPELRNRASRLLVAAAICDIFIGFSWFARAFFCRYVLSSIGQLLYICSAYFISVLAIDSFIVLKLKQSAIKIHKGRLELYYYLSALLYASLFAVSYLGSISKFVDWTDCETTGTTDGNQSDIAIYQIYFAYTPILFSSLLASLLTLLSLRGSDVNQDLISNVSSSSSNSSVTLSMVSMMDKPENDNEPIIPSSPASQKPTPRIVSDDEQKAIERKRKLRFTNYLLPVFIFWFAPFLDTVFIALGRPNPVLAYAHSMLGPCIGLANAFIFSLTETVVSPKSIKDLATNPKAEPYFRRYLMRLFICESLDFLQEAWPIIQLATDTQTLSPSQITENLVLEHQRAVERYARLSTEYVQRGSSHEINVSFYVRINLLAEVEQLTTRLQQKREQGQQFLLSSTNGSSQGDVAALVVACRDLESLLTLNALSSFKSSREFREMIEELQNDAIKKGAGARNVFAELARDIFSRFRSAQSLPRKTH